MDPAQLPHSKERQLARPWVCKAGNDPCSRTAPCRSCLGRRNRRKGKEAERKARRILGVQRLPSGAAQVGEEAWRDLHFIDECKSGAQAGPVGTRFLAMEGQALANKAIGDQRKFRAIWKPKGWGDVIVGFRGATYREYIKPALDAYWGES